MVRVDEDTSNALDAWVEAGAVKSRSAAAALFIREGLKVRDSELQDLKKGLPNAGTREMLEQTERSAALG